MEFKEIAKVDEIPLGEMKKYDVEGVEVTVAHRKDGFIAFNDRCPHMNSPLHMGKIEEGEVVCPLHKARFDLKSGKKTAEPKVPIPKAFKVGRMMSDIRTYDLILHEIKVEDGRIFVKL